MQKLLIFSVNVFILCFTLCTNAEIKLPAIVSSNMVLQRNTDIKIWGWAKPKESISIKTSWLQKSIIVITDEKGNWSCFIKTTNNKEPQQIELQSKESNILLDNILFGEVWLCSGQSNMYQPVRGFTGQPIIGSTMAIAKANNPNLRLFSVGKVASKTTLKNLSKYKTWQKATPKTVSKFSAVAYFFGQQLQEILDVPVGLIHTSWGGSKIQAWMSEESIKQFQNFDINKIYSEEKAKKIPTALFNSMIHPLINYTIKGAIWYQGESNRKEPKLYKTLFPAMVKNWRKLWGIGDFPFYYVQISPYKYHGNHYFQNPENSAFIREAQLSCLNSIPNSGIAITLDIGSQYSNHPPHKKIVADRLLFNALQKTYHIKAINADTPIYDKLEIKENSLLLKFKNVKSGLYTSNTLENFEIAGKDKVFHKASARIIDHKFILVKSDAVSNPVAVRYAWNNWVKGNLFGGNLIPVSSFRTDHWDNATRAKTN